jgi:hypothetical protein
MFQHFGNRLKRDLKQLVDRRLDASVTASGSHLRVSDPRTLLRSRASRSDELIHFTSLSLLASKLTSSLINASGS